MRNDTILVADSDMTVATYIAEALAFEGYTVHRYLCDRLTADTIEQLRPDLVIVEQWPAHADVTLLLDQLRQHATAKPMAVIVSTTDPRTLRELAAPLERRGCAMLLKPFDLDQLLESVAGALDDRWQRRPAWKPEPGYV